MYRHQFHTMFGTILRCFFRFPCSTILMWKNVIVAGFGNGQIRLYSAETGKLAAQVNAHARWVTALDVASDNGMVSLPWIVLINPIILWWEKKLTLAGIHQVLYYIVVSLHIQLLQFHWFETKCVDCVWPKKVCVSFLKHCLIRPGNTISPLTSVLFFHYVFLL